MAQLPQASSTASLELRFKRWTAVAVVCFLGLLAALPFRSPPQPIPSTVAPSHRERSLRFRAETPPDAALPAPTRPHVSQASPEATSAAPLAVKAASTRPAAEVPPPSSPLPRTGGAPLSPVQPTSPDVAVARPGENLMDIAERVLGDRRRWRELIELNPQHRSPFDELSPGAEIRLPTAATR